MFQKGRMPVSIFTDSGIIPKALEKLDISVIHAMYYLAIICPPPVNEKVLKCKHFMKEQFGCSIALKSPAHITLLPPFWMEETNETGLQAVLQSFDFSGSEIIVELNGFSHFGKRVLFINVIENVEMEKLKMQVEKHFVHSFPGIIKPDNRPFHAHITIANRDMKPHHFFDAWKYFAEKEFKESFHAKSISLLKLDSGKWNVIGDKEW